MSPIEALRSAFTQYASFGGRAPRSEFWWFHAIIAVAYLAVLWMAGQVGAAADSANAVVLVSFLPGMAVAVRRLHDTGRSGWWLLTAVIPPVAMILAALPGSPGPNHYGDPYATHVQRMSV